jgi:hypothetical protein
MPATDHERGSQAELCSAKSAGGSPTAQVVLSSSAAAAIANADSLAAAPSAFITWCCVVHTRLQKLKRR